MPESTTTTPPAPRTSRRRWPIVAALGVAVLAGLAVIVTVVPPSSPTAPPSSPTAAATATATGSAGAFTATTLAGQQVAVPGGKPSAVLFFSATCRTCGPVAHALAVAQQANPQANYVAVDLDPTETPADITRFLTTNQATTLAVADNAGGRLSGGYRVTQLSTVVILGPDGHELSRAVEPTAAQIQTAIAAAGRP